MNLIWFCHAHNLAFDGHEFGNSLGGLDNSVVFFSCLKEYDQLVADANARLADPAQPFYDMSYVSRRAIGMRICKAQIAGYFIDHGNPNAWEAVERNRPRKHCSQVTSVFEWGIFTCEHAAARGQLEVLKWARRNGYPWDFTTSDDQFPTLGT